MWRALLDKERLCEELDALVIAEGNAEAGEVQQRWSALPPLAAAWEKKLLTRRDAAIQAMADHDARARLQKRIKDSEVVRSDALLELELMLRLESPPEVQAARRAMQVKQLRNRFNVAEPGTSGAADQILLEWCAQPGVIDARDRGRCEQIIAAIERRG